MRRISELNLSYQDSIEIPKIFSDSFLNELLAVYNAVDLPERDTAITILDIHTFPFENMRSIVVAADSSLSWMQQLRNALLS